MELCNAGSNVLGPATAVSKSIEINAVPVAPIVIGLLIPVIGIILLGINEPGTTLVLSFGSVNVATVSGPLLVVTVQLPICSVPTLIVVEIVSPNVADDLFRI